tara:strand:- start:29614 stop:30042 length:429 start_codon:yes stop_codon:yes gene_type:complete
MYSLEEIYDQSLEDNVAMKVTMSNGIGVINNGVKLQKFGSKTEILNCGRSGDYFQECNEEEYNFFYDYGWKEGGLRLSLHNYKRKLDLIEYKIRNEVNSRKNDKHIQRLKSSRETLLVKYANRQLKLNKLKSNQNGQKEKLF